jgi:hypothetical protein
VKRQDKTYNSQTLFNGSSVLFGKGVNWATELTVSAALQNAVWMKARLRVGASEGGVGVGPADYGAHRGRFS